jgi:hypothetical protein
LKVERFSRFFFAISFKLPTIKSSEQVLLLKQIQHTAISLMNIKILKN